MLEALAVLVRLLPAIVALLAIAVWAILITPILAVVWVVAVPLFVIAVPLKFMGAALGGDLYYFRREIADAVDAWKTAPERHLANMKFVYRSVVNWLVGLPPPKPPTGVPGT